MLQETRPPKPCATLQTTPRTLTALKPNDLWHVDLTTVPTALGFSRRVMGLAVFRGQPTAAAVRGCLERLFRSVGHQPRHLVSDQGSEPRRDRALHPLHQERVHAVIDSGSRPSRCHGAGAVSLLLLVQRPPAPLATRCHHTRRNLLPSVSSRHWRRADRSSL